MKEGRRTLRGDRNEVAADERQTGSGKFREERRKVTAYKDKPAQKVSSWNPRWSNIIAEKHQLTWMVGSWNPRGERTEIRVLKYKVQRTAYAATTLTVSIQSQDVMQTWLHWTRQHALLVQKDKFFLAFFHPKPNGLPHLKRVPPYGGQSYSPTLGQKFCLTPLGQTVVYGELRELYWNLQENTEIS